MVTIDRIDTLPHWLGGDGPDGDIVLSTRVRLARCLKNHFFPSAASLVQRKEVFHEIATAACKLKAYKALEPHNFLTCDRFLRELLVENRLASPDLLTIEGDRGIVTVNDERISLLINEEDHLRLQCMERGFRTLAAWQALSPLDNELGEYLEFAFDDRKGYLTSSPTNCGTGLRVSFLLHLPGLILTKSIDQVLQAASHLGVSTRGFFGEHSEVVGSFFQLSNQSSLGASEEEFLATTQQVIDKVIASEREARERILNEARAELTDKAYRAYGLLLWARSLSMKEVLSLTSAIRIGVECAIFNMVSTAALNRIILLSLPAHLQLYLERELDEDGCAVARAELIREVLSGTGQ